MVHGVQYTPIEQKNDELMVGNAPTFVVFSTLESAR